MESPIDPAWRWSNAWSVSSNIYVRRSSGFVDRLVVGMARRRVASVHLDLLVTVSALRARAVMANVLLGLRVMESVPLGLRVTESVLLGLRVMESVLLGHAARVTVRRKVRAKADRVMANVPKELPVRGIGNSQGRG